MIWYNWALLATDERDYVVWNIEWLNIDKLPNVKSVINSYNQLEYSDIYWYCLCTLYAPIWMAADNSWYKFSWTEREQLCKLRTEESDFDPSAWWYLSIWNNVVRKYLKDKWVDLIQYRISTKTDDFKTILNKWYRINIWLTIWETFIEDMQDNGILNKVSFWKATYWHSTTIKKIWNNYIIDNYDWEFKFNKVEISDLQWLIDNWVIYEWAYLQIIDENNLKFKIKQKIMNDIKIESAKLFVAREWKYTNWERPQDNITREQMWAILERVLSNNWLK